MATKLKLRSNNRKLGAIVTLDRTFDTCPPECRFLHNGCYAAGRWETFIGRYGDPHWQTALDTLADKAPHGALVRLHAVGDIMHTTGDGAVTVDQDYVRALRQVFTHDRPDLVPLLFTHAWRRVPAAVFGFPVNASCETPADLDAALAAGYQPTLVTTDPDDPLIGATWSDGRRIVRCPEQTRPEQVTCDTCRLCTKDWPHRTVVVFVTHGPWEHSATTAIDAARDGRWRGRQLSWLDAADRALRQHPRPVSVRELVERIRDDGTRDLRRVKTPHQTLARDLRHAAAAGDPRFIRLGTRWTSNLPLI